MICTCNNCHFTFERTGLVDACPDCGKMVIREATDDEKDEYISNRANREFDEKQEP